MLYGDNAVGGVINIVLKNGVGGPPVAIAREAGVGSFNQRHGAGLDRAQFRTVVDASFYGNAIKSDGYRENNALDQRNGVGNLNYTTPDLKAFLTGDRRRSEARLPRRPHRRSLDRRQRTGHRPQGAATPFDYGNQQGASATAGFTKTSVERRRTDRRWRGADRRYARRLLRHRTVCIAASELPSTYNDAALQTWSITPRLSIKNAIFGLPSQILTGIDYYDATFHQDRAGVQRHAADPHLRSVAANAGRLLAAHRRLVADDRFLLWRPDPKHHA